jgi:hypothetical protein
VSPHLEVLANEREAGGEEDAAALLVLPEGGGGEGGPARPQGRPLQVLGPLQTHPLKGPRHQLQGHNISQLRHYKMK